MNMKQDKCMNCGNSINYNEIENGVYVCPFCRTKYHIDKLGYIEEYKVKLMFMGHLLECYLNTYTVEQTPMCATYITDSYERYILQPPTITLEFTGYLKDN